ncbi:MAG: nucleotidyltransferase family protein, partial [Halieaceae bacterium]|nr:nucleotidyltransferase family protein [Halieaceae bacterium]
PSTSSVAAVLLAAGESRRMGDINKLSLDIAGTPLLRHAVLTLLASRVTEVLVVTGHEAEWASDVLADLPVRLVHNAQYTSGQASSVMLGLSAISDGHDSILMCLSDQPLLTPSDLNQLLDAFDNVGQKPILVPRYQGVRGNPALLSAELRRSILTKSGNPGCRSFMDENPQLVAFWEAPNDHFTRDVDTPDDYKALQNADKTAH